jgi:hypothetical protein
MKIHCKYDELKDPRSLKDHPKNRNKHSVAQVERLAALYKYHEIRHPIIVSKLSGYIVAGHGRKMAAIKAGLKEFPVVYQDFDSPEAEYAFMQADNAIALWAEIDYSGINQDLVDLGPDFDINMLGIKDFTLDPINFEAGNIEDQGKLDELSPIMAKCPNCESVFNARENEP